MNITYALTDTKDLADAINTFVVYDGDDAIGRVTVLGCADWRVTYAGLGVTGFSPYYPWLTRNEATRALLASRETARATTVTVSGLTGLQEDVLVAAKEIGINATDDQYAQHAAKLAISLTNFKQILFALIDDDRAEAFLPLTIRRIRDERATKQARVSRFTRRPQVAAAS